MSIPSDYPTFLLSTNTEAELAVATERVRSALERAAESPAPRRASGIRRLLRRRRSTARPRPA